MCVGGLANETVELCSRPAPPCLPYTAGRNKRKRCDRRALAAPNCVTHLSPTSVLFAVQVGTTIFHTLAGVLLLLLVSPIYDGARIYYSTKDKSEQAALDLRCVHGFLCRFEMARVVFRSATLRQAGAGGPLCRTASTRL